MEEFEGFVNTLEIKAQSTIELQKIGFNFEEYLPVLVSFTEDGNRYLYAAPIDMETQVGDLLLVPAKRDDNFELVKVVSTRNQVDSKFLRTIKRIVRELENSENRQVRTVAFNIGQKDGNILKPYFNNIEKEKKKSIIMKQLEDEAAKAQKIIMYKTLATTNPEIKKLLDELEEL